jgi:hypothetical protein
VLVRFSVDIVGPDDRRGGEVPRLLTDPQRARDRVAIEVPVEPTGRVVAPQRELAVGGAAL